MGAPERSDGQPLPNDHELRSWIGEMSRGRCRVTFSVLVARRRLTGPEIRALHRQHGWATASCASTLTEIQRRLSGSGWHLDYLDCGGAALAGGDNPRGRSPQKSRPERRPLPDRAPEHSKPPADIYVPPEVPARIIAGRRELRLPAAPGGCCQYMVVVEGKAVPCGAPAKGTYCAEHKAKSAGLERAGWSW